MVTKEHDEGVSRSGDRRARSTSFGAVAEHYGAFRPGPPREAVRWLFPNPVDTVVDVGAGTGTLTRLLTEVATHVIAIEPDPEMRQVLAASTSGIEVLNGTGEAIPVIDHSADGVVASSSWHWVEPSAGLSEAARVLRAEGVMAVMWTGPDPDGKFMAQARSALGSDDDQTLRHTLDGEYTPAALALEIPVGFPFTDVEHRRFAWLLPLTSDELIGLLGTLSWIILTEEDDRRRLYETARRLLRDVLGVEGHATVEVDFVCDVYRARRVSPVGTSATGSLGEGR